jgi:hypothetical protein
VLRADLTKRLLALSFRFLSNTTLQCRMMSSSSTSPRVKLSVAVLLIASASLATAYDSTVACSANSPRWCFQGSSNSIYNAPLLIDPSLPSTSNCSCMSYTAGSTTVYFVGNATDVAIFSAYPASYNVQFCSTDFCNCAAPGCINPFTSGACPPGSSGPISCRYGFSGVDPDNSTLVHNPGDVGNLLSFAYPAGTLCMAISSGNSSSLHTTYMGINASSCPGYSYPPYSNVSSCSTSNCGSPSPTWTGCGASFLSSNANSCYTGATAPAALLSSANFASLSASLWGGSVSAPYTPTAVPVGPAACIYATATCQSLSHIDLSLCPPGQSVTLYAYALATPSAWGASSSPPEATCYSIVQQLSQLGFAPVLCSGTNCNVPGTTPILATLTTTLSGYTVPTFAAAAKSAFITAVSSSLVVLPSTIYIINVASAARRQLLTGGVIVTFSVLGTQTASTLAAQLSQSNFPAALSASFAAAQLTVPTASPVASVPIPPPPSTSHAPARGPWFLQLALCAAALLLI